MAIVLGGLGLVSAVHHTRRLVAAFHLKQGRMIVETTPILMGGQPVPLWSAAEYHFAQGSRALAAGDEPRARQSFNLASVLMHHEVVREAEAAFRAALRWAPRYADARSRLGALLLMRGDAAAAANEAARTLQDLESSEIWERLGLALWLKGDRKGAAEAWQVPARRRPLEADYFRALIKNAGTVPDEKEHPPTDTEGQG